MMDLELEDRIPVVAERIQYKAGATLALQDDAGGAGAITVLKTTGTTFTSDQSLTLWKDAAVTVNYTAGGAPLSVVT